MHLEPAPTHHRQEQSEGGTLKEWIDKILALNHLAVVVIATAEYDPDHYANEGHREAAEFLKYFKHIQFSPRLSKGECQDNL